MLPITISELIPVLQTVIGPVILISGVGLLLLTMTNRLGRLIDRSRLLWKDLELLEEPKRGAVLAQLRILSDRAALVKSAITLAALSVLLAALLVITLFLTALFGLEDAWLVSLLFIGCMASLIGSMAAFIRDVNKSLEALRLEIGDFKEA